ncbi:sugar ABC transporter ATP-binding protein [Arthrobacter bambusae]|uniref:sugar ABC transporter ATP-binding protein n=1 Tax=Arthrobacter bambusae TaxID=1338426 RepID=UPI00277D1AB7|nr:sugar ABC transporter ATP-binding protein [Arthrobacter bambusae]MDQ0028531.1 ABC-type sugar transport system ATPase subunit [Arthrobacter bambusae]MDQ0096675.1 ABC-type sugar transport system ATPase subunit [Arthrobacter bambusae]
MAIQQLATPEHVHPGRAPEISVAGIGKRYGSSTVLQGVTLSIAPGEIHGIMGENGAGKSTLLKILGGAIVADSGTVALDGRTVRITAPRDSISNGISLISQELALIPGLSVLENVFLGRWSNTGSLLRSRKDAAHFARLLEETGFTLDPRAIVGTLPIGQAQQVEILKALARGAKVLCMDEPTAVLNEAEKAQLLQVIRKLASSGTTVILVSHYLEEVLGLVDRVTVLRDGRHIVTEDAAGHTPESLVGLMVGREVDFVIPEIPPVPAGAKTVFEAVGLTSTKVKDVSFTVRQGEILGLAGLVGSGRSEALLAAFGADRITAGHVEINGRRIRGNSIREAIKAGIGLVPESRKEQGLVMSRPASENIALPTLSDRSLGGLVRVGREKTAVAGITRSVDLRGARKGAPIANLSGGNQQKALFAKWLLNPPAVLMVDEPTRGVDIAAKALIHGLIVELAARGTAVIVVSSELEEVIGLSHRIHVMRQGRIVAEFDRNASRDEVMTSAFMK